MRLPTEAGRLTDCSQLSLYHPPLSLLPISYPGIAAADLALVASVLLGFGTRRVDLDADGAAASPMLQYSSEL